MGEKYSFMVGFYLCALIAALSGIIVLYLRVTMIVCQAGEEEEFT